MRDAPRQMAPPVPIGTEVRLIKRGLHAGEDSNIQVGGGMQGTLADDIVVGRPVQLEKGGNTSEVRRMYRREGKLYIDTQTSTYEVMIRNKGFKGLELHNELGEIALPPDATEAQMGRETVDLNLHDTKNDRHFKIYINKTALQGILLEVHNGEIFRAVNNRLMVVARVGNIHIPFYISSKGTSGKRKGEWYPFFGYADDWIIKGSINGANGEMTYHPEISKVQKILNENLVIPMDVLSPRGKIGTGEGKVTREPEKPIFDIGRHFKYQHSAMTEYGEKDDYDESFIRRITGYNPKNVRYHGPSSRKWIGDIVSRI